MDRRVERSRLDTAVVGWVAAELARIMEEERVSQQATPEEWVGLTAMQVVANFSKAAEMSVALVSHYFKIAEPALSRSVMDKEEEEAMKCVLQYTKDAKEAMDQAVHYFEIAKPVMAALAIKRKEERARQEAADSARRG